MPWYVRVCPSKHYYDSKESMQDSKAKECPKCGQPSRRKPPLVSVTWGGTPPSQGGVHPLVRQHESEYPRFADEFAEQKEEHVNRTSHHHLN